ncbi:hypothetical protein PR202_gb06860 [Eleusine coracana subsp. coracana]|uniref:Uncharacterized protein n=1 Tax=Eleusine coracana subsp. coracana TaxID=191504 RepID=A0AAV5EAL4_ELECO|nr:hypothetical protein PR202_gb06860 [Eleusine coracana subsp. coracana]
MALFPTTIGSEAGGSGSYIYSTTASHGNGSSTTDEIQLPWGSVHQHHKALQQKGASSPRSSSITSTISLGSNMLEFSNNSSSSPRECISTSSGTAFKKARTQEPSPAQSTVKVRKEKLGDRITALHQLVSPFGKALSSPYVGGSNGGGGGTTSFNQPHQASLDVQIRACSALEMYSWCNKEKGTTYFQKTLARKEAVTMKEKKDLKSRGLCLVPVSCTLDVGVDVIAGPADYWGAAPAFGMGFGG